MRRFWNEYRGTLLFLILMMGFRSAWADWVVVPTGSMNPTVLEGDRVLVETPSYLGALQSFSLYEPEFASVAADVVHLKLAAAAHLKAATEGL